MSRGAIAAMSEVQARMHAPINEAAEMAGLSLDWIAENVTVLVDPERSGPWIVETTSATLDSAQLLAAHDAAVCLLMTDDVLDTVHWRAAAAYLSNAYQYAVTVNAHRKAVERSETASKNASAERRPEMNAIIARLARHEGGAKTLWPRLVGELDSEGLDPVEGISPKGDMQVHYDTRDGDRSSITAGELRNRLSQARKAKD